MYISRGVAVVWMRQVVLLEQILSVVVSVGGSDDGSKKTCFEPLKTERQRRAEITNPRKESAPSAHPESGSQPPKLLAWLSTARKRAGLPVTGGTVTCSPRAHIPLSTLHPRLATDDA